MTFLLDVRMCSACAAQSEVVDCRPTRGGFRRRRVCSCCGARWRTMEVRMEEYQPVRDFLTEQGKIELVAAALETAARNLRGLRTSTATEP